MQNILLKIKIKLLPTSKSASLLLRFSKSQPWRRGRLGRSPNFKLQTRPNSHYKNGKVIRQRKSIKYKTIRTKQITLSHLTCLCYYGGAGRRRLSVYMHALVRWVVTTCLITACVWAHTRSLFLHLTLPMMPLQQVEFCLLQHKQYD